jgi:hypothetical protein
MTIIKFRGKGKGKGKFWGGEKLTFLRKLQVAMGALILLSMGFIFGSYYQASNLFIPLVLVFIGAGGSVVIGHYVEKEMKTPPPPPPPPRRRYK